MATVDTKWQGTAQARLVALETGVRTGMMMAGAFLIQRVKTVFALYNPRGHASGQLIRSLSVSSPKLVNGWWRCQVGPTAKHGIFVHMGTGPAAGLGPRRMPPVDAILDWVKEKGIVPKFEMVRARAKSGKYAKGYVQIRRKARDIENQQRQVAFLIARSIGRKGTVPFPFLSAPFKMYRKEMEQIIVSQILRSLRST